MNDSSASGVWERELWNGLYHDVTRAGQDLADIVIGSIPTQHHPRCSGGEDCDCYMRLYVREIAALKAWNERHA